VKNAHTKTDSFYWGNCLAAVLRVVVSGFFVQKLALSVIFIQIVALFV